MNRPLTQDDIDVLRSHHRRPGLKLSTASGLQGEISNSRTVITTLIDMAEQSLKKSAYQEGREDAQDQIKTGHIYDVPAAVKSFQHDHPDSEFQWGFFSALVDHMNATDCHQSLPSND